MIINKIIKKAGIGAYLRDFLINTVAASSMTPHFWRLSMYRLYGLKVKSNAIVKPGCFFWK